MTEQVATSKIMNHLGPAIFSLGTSILITWMMEQVATNEMMNHLGTAILILGTAVLVVTTILVVIGFIVAYKLYRNYEDYRARVLLDFSSNAPMIIDSGAEDSAVPLNYHLENERSPPYVIHTYCSAATDHFLVAQATGELPLNLPKQARTAHKMNCDVPILAVREPVKQGCIVVFGYGENKDAIICDKDDIEIIVTGSPLVTGKVGRDGLWYVSDYDPLPGQQQRSPPASSSLSMLSSNAPIVIDSGACHNIVPLDFRLNNERPTPNGIRFRSFSNHVMVAQETGELPLINLPKRARTAHRIDVKRPLMSVSEPVKQECVVVFGYGENKDAIICDENDIEIILKKPPLVTGKVGRDGYWYVGSRSYHEWLTAAIPTPEQQMRQLIDRLSACIAEVPSVEEEGGEDE